MSTLSTVTKVEGIWVDPVIHIAEEFPRNTPIAVAVGNVTDKLTRQVRSNIGDACPSNSLETQTILHHTQMGQSHLIVLCRPPPSSCSIHSQIESLRSLNQKLVAGTRKNPVISNDETASELSRLNTAVEGLLASGAEQGQKITKLEKIVVEQKDTIAKQGQKITKLEKIVVEQKDVIAAQEDKIQGLDDEVEKYKKELDNLCIELNKERAERHSDVEALMELSALVAPIYLRALLDKSRRKVVNILQSQSWDALREGEEGIQLASRLLGLLARATHQPSHPPSLDALEMVCSLRTGVRRAGNISAHNASRSEIREAISTSHYQVPDIDRQHLGELFKFVYDEEL